MDKDSCKQIKFYRVLRDSQICAGGEKGKDSCRGDSGGPLMAEHLKKRKSNWFAVGILSFGDETCGEQDSPAVYTRVAHYVDWITSKMLP